MRTPGPVTCCINPISKKSIDSVACPPPIVTFIKNCLNLLSRHDIHKSIESSGAPEGVLGEAAGVGIEARNIPRYIGEREAVAEMSNSPPPVAADMHVEVSHDSLEKEWSSDPSAILD